MRILADTNVIIDALTSREPWNKSAEEIFLMAANHTIEMYITASSATDIYYLIRKHLHNIEAAKMIMGKLYSLTGILEVQRMTAWMHLHLQSVTMRMQLLKRWHPEKIWIILSQEI